MHIAIAMTKITRNLLVITFTLIGKGTQTSEEILKETLKHANIFLFFFFEFYDFFLFKRFNRYKGTQIH